MDETRRFLRYVIPGVVYTVLTAVLLWIICPGWIQSIITSNLGKDNLGAILGSVFVFGGLGYIFSTIHHVCHCWCNEICAGDRILDHRSIAEHLKHLGLAEGVKEGEKAANVAMAISYAYWYEQMRLGNIGNGANHKLDSLGDQAHGLGAARVASFFSLTTALLILYNKNYFALEFYGESFRFYGMLVLGIFITICFHSSYKRVGEIAHATYKNILNNTLPKEPKNTRNQSTDSH